MSTVAGAADPSIVEDPALVPTISGYFIGGGTLLDVNTLTGGSWYVLNTAGNALPDANNRWLIAQVTTTGSISDRTQLSGFPAWCGCHLHSKFCSFDGAGEFGGRFFNNPWLHRRLSLQLQCGCGFRGDGSCTYPAAIVDCDGNCVNDADGDGICDENEILGCTVEAACNYTPVRQTMTALVPKTTRRAFVVEQVSLQASATIVIASARWTLAVCATVTTLLAPVVLMPLPATTKEPPLTMVFVRGRMWFCGRIWHCRRSPRLRRQRSMSAVCVAVRALLTGDCDCAGNVLDACGVCGGSGVDADADGICDDIDDCVGQLDECGVCNGDGSSCADPCAAAGQSSPYTLTVESSPAANVPGRFTDSTSTPMTPQIKCLRFLVMTKHILIINAPAGIFNSPANTSWSAAGINPLFLPFFPDMADDSYATIGLDGPASGDAADPSIVEDVVHSRLPFLASLPLLVREHVLERQHPHRWFLVRVLNTAANALLTNGRWLIAQITTDRFHFWSNQLPSLPTGCWCRSGSNINGF